MELIQNNRNTELPYLYNKNIKYTITLLRGMIHTKTTTTTTTTTTIVPGLRKLAQFDKLSSNNEYRKTSNKRRVSIKRRGYLSQMY